MRHKIILSVLLALSLSMAAGSLYFLAPAAAGFAASLAPIPGLLHTGAFNVIADVVAAVMLFAGSQLALLCFLAKMRGQLVAD